MAPTGQILDDVGGDLPLQLDVLSSGPLDPGRVQGLLGIHVVVHRVHHHQDMALGLHKGPHHAEGAHRLPVPHQEPGDDGVVGPLPSGQAVITPLVQ